MEIKTWDDGKVSDVTNSKYDENAVLLRKSKNSEGHSNETSEETRDTKSSDLGENGMPFYHELDNASQEEKYMEQKFRKQLNGEARRAVACSVHENIRLIVHRPEVKLIHREQYFSLSKKLEPVIRELVRKTEPLLEHEVSADFMKHRAYGSKFNADNIIYQDFRYFARKRPPEEEASLAVALRIDESASMNAFGRLEAARCAAAAVYELCSRCGIPILIYGDTADRSRLEQMSVFAYSDFEKADPDDRFRLMNIQGRSNNRDGMALRILGEKLLASPKQNKLLISISDGQPKATPNYTGDFAIEDMRNTIKEYKRKGITFLAAAIGQDKDVICDIYGRSCFLDITDLKQFPTRLMQMIVRYL